MKRLAWLPLLLLAAEAAWGVVDPAFYQGFGARIAGLKHELLELLSRVKAEGKRIDYRLQTFDGGHRLSKRVLQGLCE